MMVAQKSGLIVEITDGEGDRYRGSLYYDLAKATVIRIGFDLSHELREHGVCVLSATPGFLRSEAMLEYFEVTEGNWRDGIAKDPHFAQSETPRFVGRGLAALAADPDRYKFAGQTLTSWDLAKRYDFDDVDGNRPDWGTYFRILQQESEITR
jgi:NAD(P)-dependent dehydrogenase (short-subunit alcohol dehydrogenase family)